MHRNSSGREFYWKGMFISYNSEMGKQYGIFVELSREIEKKIKGSTIT